MLQAKRPADRQAFLEELARLWPLAKGSLTEVRKPCIRPRCPACKAGRKHKAVFFSFPQGGKRVCRRVPAELAPLLRQALAPLLAAAMGLRGQGLSRRAFRRQAAASGKRPEPRRAHRETGARGLLRRNAQAQGLTAKTASNSPQLRHRQALTPFPAPHIECR